MNEVELADIAMRLRDGAASVVLESYDDGAYRGRLSTSALSTATASIALTLYGRQARDDDALAHARRGRAWLVAHANADGGFGDTVDSPSNVSTTLLAWSAFGLATDEPGVANARAAAAACCSPGAPLSPDIVAATLADIYGDDQTFAVPILMTYALCAGDDAPQVWPHVPRLPFELAACPHQWFWWLGLPMVSYALPALIAIGQCIERHRPTWNPLAAVARALTTSRTRRILGEIQPINGGYLEATPLTSFVTMAMVSMRQHEHDVVRRAVGFLQDSVLEDGSWPIDTNLDTWTTTLAVHALTEAGAPIERADVTTWLLDQQYRDEHPYTHAAPGGWAWTDLPGGVPDADDTAGALLALARLHPTPSADIIEAASAAIGWLLDLRNRDGGVPTFCRGWGRLPFDKSTPDLTAHALRAWAAWRPRVDEALGPRMDAARDRAVDYLLSAQDEDGFWMPLWFGRQPDGQNRVYGTAKVLAAMGEIRCEGARGARWRASGVRAVEALVRVQNPDGGWDGESGTVEETALAVEGLAAQALAGAQVVGLSASIARGLRRLDAMTAGGSVFPTAPIGLYFARLWYSERLYPALFTASAAGIATRLLDRSAAMRESTA